MADGVIKSSAQEKAENDKQDKLVQERIQNVMKATVNVPNLTGILKPKTVITKTRTADPYAPEKPKTSGVPEKTVYSVPSTERTLSLFLAGVNVGNLLKMPDFSVNAVYDEQVMQKLMTGIAKIIAETLDVVGQMIPTVDLDLGNTTFRGMDGIQETTKAFMAMHGVSVFSNGIFTRKFFDHVSHQKYSFSLRCSHEQLNALMTMKTAFMPRPFEKDTVKNIAEGVLGLLRYTSWMSDPDTGKSFASEYLDTLETDADNAVNQGILTYKGTSGVSAEKLSSNLKKLTDAHDAKVKKLVDNYLDVTPDTEENSKKDFSWTEGMDNFGIAKDKFKIASRDAIIGIDKQTSEEIEIIGKVVGTIANATTVSAPLQLMGSDMQIFYGSNEVTDRIVQRPATKGIIYRNQHLVIDSLTVNPSESMMVSSSSGMTPLYYDVEIALSTTMTPVAR